MPRYSPDTRFTLTPKGRAYVAERRQSQRPVPALVAQIQAERDGRQIRDEQWDLLNTLDALDAETAALRRRLATLTGAGD